MKNGIREKRIYDFDFSGSNEAEKAKIWEEIKLCEGRFARLHADDSNEELCEYLREVARELGRVPKRQETIGFQYIKSRLGPWPRALEKAGLKDISPKKTIKNPPKKKNSSGGKKRKKSNRNMVDG